MRQVSGQDAIPLFFVGRCPLAGHSAPCRFRVLNGAAELIVILSRILHVGSSLRGIRKKSSLRSRRGKETWSLTELLLQVHVRSQLASLKLPSTSSFLGIGRMSFEMHTALINLVKVWKMMFCAGSMESHVESICVVADMIDESLFIWYLE